MIAVRVLLTFLIVPLPFSLVNDDVVGRDWVPFFLLDTLTFLACADVVVVNEVDDCDNAAAEVVDDADGESEPARPLSAAPNDFWSDGLFGGGHAFNSEWCISIPCCC